MAIEREKLASLFQELDGERTGVMDRAELCASLTVPYLFVEDNQTGEDDLEREPVQGYGAKLVNHLVGKFALSILPPSTPFFRFTANDKEAEEVTGGDKKIQQGIEDVMATLESRTMKKINQTDIRKVLYPVLKYAMVTGDCLLEETSDGKYRIFSMKNYVIKRDSSGNIISLVIKESISPKALSDDIKSTLTDKELNSETDLTLYTGAIRNKNSAYDVYQQIEETDVDGEQTIKKFTDRFISVGWNRIQGEDYARGYVEEYLGSFIQLNKQMRVVEENAVLNSKSVFVVNPNGMTKYEDFVRATNGDIITGSEQDVGIIRASKFSELNNTYNLINEFKKELAEAFLLGSASVRDAERVTAKEIQMIASELESAFGGVYTIIASDIQMPIVESALSKVDNVEESNIKSVDISITAGVEALGRNVELTKINSMLQEVGNLAQLVGAENVNRFLNISAIIKAIAINSGISDKNYIRTEEEVNKQVSQEKENEVANKMLDGGLPQAGQNIANQVTQ